MPRNVSPTSRRATPAGGDEADAADAFAVLANETRLAILLALWRAREPLSPGPDDLPREARGLAFSDLYDRVEYGPSANFQYHLAKLTGRFVRKTAAGYALTTSGERVLSVILAGSLTASPSFSDEPLDAACMRCGGPTVVDYSDGILTHRCERCRGVVDEPDAPDGVLGTEYRPPVGLANRTPREFATAGKTWQRLRRHALIEGTCPDCSGTVTATLDICDRHATGDGEVCETCRRRHRVEALLDCDVCPTSLKTGVWSTVLPAAAVVAFFHEHGLDSTALEDDFDYATLFGAVESVTVRDREPPRVTIALELDGDRLAVTVDGSLDVTDVTAEPGD